MQASGAMAELPRPGLCEQCVHVRRVESARGSVFLRCALHDEDPRFAKYPRLPVLQCPGFARSAS